MQAAMKVERSVVIEADQARVWKALTKSEQIAKWFQIFEFDKPEVGQKIHTHWEPNDAVDFNETFGEVAIVEPISRFGFRWQISPPDPTMTLVIFDLETVGSGTRVTVTETGFEALPEGLRQKRFADNTGGWEAMIESLATYVQGQTK